MSDVAYTFEWYGEFLDELRDHGCRFKGYDTALEAGDVVLRHDVDWSPRRALQTARMEAERDIEATYFFLVATPFYNLSHKPNREILSRIASLGHDVGLHFSTHQHWNEEPPQSALLAAVDSERQLLARTGPDPVDAVSFHRPPEWVFRRSFPTFTSTYAERFFSEVAYRGDSNQRWRDVHPLDDGVPETMQVLTHPGLWGWRDGTFEERLATVTDTRLARTRRFMFEQFVEKKYNIDEFCDFEDLSPRRSKPAPNPQ